MGMIDRYKKKGGFLQLLNLLETTGKEKQEKFLKMIADENPVWETEIKKRMLSLDKILSWNSVYQSEIFPKLPALQLASIIGGLPKEKSQSLLNILNTKEKRQVEELLATKVPTAGETSAAVMKLFGEIRKMEAEGSLDFEKFDPSMITPEDIEAQLEKNTSAASSPTSTASVSAPPAAGTKSTVNTTKSKEAPQFSKSPIPKIEVSLPSAASIEEENKLLKVRIIQLTQENCKLATENSDYKKYFDSLGKKAG